MKLEHTSSRAGRCGRRWPDARFGAYEAEVHDLKQRRSAALAFLYLGLKSPDVGRGPGRR